MPVRDLELCARREMNIDIAGVQYPLLFECNIPALSANAESRLAASLLASMSVGSDITIDAPVSRRLLESARQLMDIYSVWQPTLMPVKVSAGNPTTTVQGAALRVGSFFSGGVDSFYTVLKHHEEITHLIFVHGFDISLDDAQLYAKTSEMVHRVAASLGREVIEVRTNLRTILDAYVPWGMLGHGAALATIGHLLSPFLGKIYIPASHTYADMFPWGSHPVVDPLWSSESLQFVHDGGEAARAKKVALIAGSDVALRSLRVCYKNPGGAYNCGRCEKCVRTMISLRVAGALDRCTTFDAPLELSNVRKIRVVNDNARAFILGNLEALEGRPEEKELALALRMVLNRSQWPEHIRKAIVASAAQCPLVYRTLRRANRMVRRWRSRA